MTAVRFEYDEATAIVVPGDGGEDVALWPRAAVERFAAHHDLDPQRRAALERVLHRAQRGAASDPATNILLHDPGTDAWAPLRLTLLEGGLPPAQQQEYLAPAGVLRPQLRGHVASGLGVGYSATVLTDASTADIRWLYLPGGQAFFAVLRAVPLPAVMGLAVAVENILESVRLDGLAPGTADAFALDGLVPPADTGWRS